MAIFGAQKNTKEKKEKKDSPKKEKAVSAPVASEKKSAPVAVSGIKEVLIRPRITEKAANLTAQNVYTFDIVKSATKKDIVKAVKALYKVTPVKVAVVNIPAKKVAMRSRRGFGKSNETRKAYVYLKKGEEIQFA